MALIKPVCEQGDHYWIPCKYNKIEVDNFFNSINFVTKEEDVKGKKIYLDVKSISQSKLREAGFEIKRDKDKADIIVISNLLKYKSENHNNTSEYYFKIKGSKFYTEKYFDNIILDEPKNYKYIFDSDLYKYIYKYEGNQELFNNCAELFESKDSNNTQIAMEFISNANWGDNKIYLMELFNNYWDGSTSNCMRYNNYKTSISFKGFLESLDFDYKWVRFNSASDYRNLCINEEHHLWVFNKYSEDFKKELNYLINKYKLKIDKLEYSIDKDYINNSNNSEEEEE